MLLDGHTADAWGTEPVAPGVQRAPVTQRASEHQHFRSCKSCGEPVTRKSAYCSDRCWRKDWTPPGYRRAREMLLAEGITPNF